MFFSSTWIGQIQSSSPIHYWYCIAPATPKINTVYSIPRLPLSRTFHTAPIDIANPPRKPPGRDRSYYPAQEMGRLRALLTLTGPTIESFTRNELCDSCRLSTYIKFSLRFWEALPVYGVDDKHHAIHTRGKIITPQLSRRFVPSQIESLESNFTDDQLVLVWCTMHLGDFKQ